MQTLAYQSVLREARQQVREGLELSNKYMLETAQQAPGELGQRMNTIMSRKGKRVRSTLLFLLAGTGEQNYSLDRAARASASVEMLHLASLVHDDVIDATSLRRGMVTAHEEWGNKMAVLVGDYILSQSMELVVGDEDRRLAVIVARASSRLVAGEILELDLAGRLDASFSQYMSVIEGKTGALLDATARCGAILAGHNAEMVESCGRMGMDFGVAFQIIDDLLDFGIGASDLGKATFSDIANGLLTLPVILYLRSAGAEANLEFADLIAQAKEPAIQERIKGLLEQSGSFSEAQGIALLHTARALEVLNSLPPSTGREQLVRMCGAMAFRSN